KIIIFFHTTYISLNKLFCFLSQCDRRLLEMALVLKYWSMLNQTSTIGIVHPDDLLMMLIFFLQQTYPPVLPTVERLQELPTSHPESSNCYVNQFYFCNDMSKIE